jgi:serine/threonine protein kinase
LRSIGALFDGIAESHCITWPHPLTVTCGSQKDWPDMACLPKYKNVNPQAPPDLKHDFVGIEDDALELLKKMMRFNPLKRITAQKALEDPYFNSDPQRTPQSDLPVPAVSPEPVVVGRGIKRPRSGSPPVGSQ